jgi:hypothetical protein
VSLDLQRFGKQEIMKISKLNNNEYFENLFHIFVRNGAMWTGLVWLRIGTDGELL